MRPIRPKFPVGDLSALRYAPRVRTVLFAILLSACAAHKLGPGLPTQTTLARVDSPKTGQRYAVYLPVKPVIGRFIVGFTPDGNAAGLAARLSLAAERIHAVVLVPHGVGDGPWDPIEKTMARMTKDLRELDAKPSESFGIGFSGGSRMAMRFAYSQHQRGVVACGGFFPWQVMPTEPDPPLVVGLVGEQDLGGSEMATAEAFFDKIEAPAWFERFDGKHEWPPADLLARSFERLVKADAMPTEPEFARASAWLKGKPHWATHHLLQIIRMHPDQAPQARALRAEWLAQPDVAQVELQLAKIERLQETTDPKEFDDALKLAQKLSGEAGPLRVRARTLSAGIFDVISQRAAIFSRDKLSTKADALIAIAERAPPDDANVHYNLACAHALLGHDGPALRHLERALELGFRDRAWAKRDPDFKALQNDARFKALVD